MDRMMRGLAGALGLAMACGVHAAEAPAAASPAAPPLCSDAWNRMIETKVTSGDGRGHGPDIGSDEWKGTIEFRLGVRGKPEIPPRSSEAWCRAIDDLVRARDAKATPKPATGTAPTTQGPTFDCRKVKPGSIEALICGDVDLSALDRKLAGVYAAATKKAKNEHPPVLRAEQRGWVKGRNDCWKSAEKRSCVRDEYVRRIAELQAKYRLVPSRGPFAFACDGSPANEVTVTYFETEPSTMIAERGDSVSLMFQQIAASGAKYQGRNESFWEHQGVATITWGYGAPEMRCTLKR
ncbi:MAG TPA: MliC family protein [Burkholderiaceae bacterium]|nr:MliC family protein [Burkholderiaceae bacterium]